MAETLVIKAQNKPWSIEPAPGTTGDIISIISRLDRKRIRTPLNAPRTIYLRSGEKPAVYHLTHDETGELLMKIHIPADPGQRVIVGTNDRFMSLSPSRRLRLPQYGMSLRWTPSR